MTGMIYRGARHDGARSLSLQPAQPLGTRAMVYRGVRHDPQPRPVTAPFRPVTLCYRGVQYLPGTPGALSERARRQRPVQGALALAD